MNPALIRNINYNITTIPNFTLTYAFLLHSNNFKFYNLQHQQHHISVTMVKAKGVSHSNLLSFAIKLSVKMNAQRTQHAKDSILQRRNVQQVLVVYIQQTHQDQMVDQTKENIAKERIVKMNQVQITNNKFSGMDTRQEFQH